MDPKEIKHNTPVPERVDLLLLVNAKKMGLSFEELNQFVFADYIEFINLYIGNTDSSTGIIRKASQDDIDKFFARG